MRPAFSSAKSASAFALLLLVILLLPVLLRGRLLPPHRESYLLRGWDTTGDYPWLFRQIFEEKGDIDLAFVGSSRIWLGIDTVYVEQRLSERLGRPAVVRTIAWGGGGYDALYFAVQDLLQNRKVRVLVFTDECQAYNVPNPYARCWFRFGENGADLAGFPRRIQSDYYFAAILGLPKNLLDLLRPNLPSEMTAAQIAGSEKAYNCTNPAARLGSLALQQGFSRSPIFQDDHPRFESFTPGTGAEPTDAVVYSAATKAMFQITGPPMPAWQARFAQKFAALATEKHSRLVLLHVPDLADAGQSAVPEREFWPDTLQADVTLLGFPPQKLFAGLNDDEIRKLFAEPYHLNQNGQEYFTRLITPALLKIYETSTNN